MKAVKIPKPGVPVRGSRTGQPVMALLDLLGRRMTLRVVWELWQARSPLTFRALELAAQTNPALLNTRLRELRATGLVLHAAGGYALTPGGRELAALLMPVSGWAERWAARWIKPKSSGSAYPRRRDLGADGALGDKRSRS